MKAGCDDWRLGHRPAADESWGNPHWADRRSGACCNRKQERSAMIPLPLMADVGDRVVAPR